MSPGRRGPVDHGHQDIFWRGIAIPARYCPEPCCIPFHTTQCACAGSKGVPLL
uniref:Uncharacterized protein n=1 Tax=Anguilla anguilla TaxID=7936 RepID=A0A0E9UD15_ANGAN